MAEFTHPLGDTIRYARNQQNLSQAKLAEIANIDVRTVLNIENYKGNPKMEVLFPLIRALNIDPNEIFYPERSFENSETNYLHFLIDTCNEYELAALHSVIVPLLDALRTKNDTANE